MNTQKKLKRDRRFQPCPVDDNDERFPNGIFDFNITKMVEFIDSNRDKVTLENVDVNSTRTGLTTHLDESTIESANLSAPVILAEISPGKYNLIDGHHRLEKAFRLGKPTLPAYKLTAPQHIPFLTTQRAYDAYMEYWNEKVKDIQRYGL